MASAGSAAGTPSCSACSPCGSDRGDLPIALLGIALCGLALLVAAWLAPTGDFRRRGIPFACAIVPPTAALLVARVVATGGGMGS